MKKKGIEKVEEGTSKQLKTPKSPPEPTLKEIMAMIKIQNEEHLDVYHIQLHEEAQEELCQKLKRNDEAMAQISICIYSMVKSATKLAWGNEAK